MLELRHQVRGMPEPPPVDQHHSGLARASVIVRQAHLSLLWEHRLPGSLIRILQPSLVHHYSVTPHSDTSCTRHPLLLHVAAAGCCGAAFLRITAMTFASSRV